MFWLTAGTASPHGSRVCGAGATAPLEKSSFSQQANADGAIGHFAFASHPDSQSPPPKQPLTRDASSPKLTDTRPKHQIPYLRSHAQRCSSRTRCFCCRGYITAPEIPARDGPFDATRRGLREQEARYRGHDSRPAEDDFHERAMS